MQKIAVKTAVLFDFDGVIMDTEGQYTLFWNEIGEKYLNEMNFGSQIKGQTLKQIYDRYFAGMNDVQQQITTALNNYEKEMTYTYIPGVVEFLEELKRNSVKTALVTSSNDKKMDIVYNMHPALKQQFDYILTANNFKQSKPHPECFLVGMERCGTTPEHTFVFEDSFHGLQAGISSGATVIGLATTNSRDSLQGKAHHIIDDFREMTLERLLSL